MENEMVMEETETLIEEGRCGQDIAILVRSLVLKDILNVRPFRKDLNGEV